MSQRCRGPPYQLRGERNMQCPGFIAGRGSGWRPRGARDGGLIQESRASGPCRGHLSLKQPCSMQNDTENTREKDRLAEIPHPRPQGTRHRRNRKLESASSKEMQKERQKAMEAVASLSRSDLGCHLRVDEYLEHLRSDLDSEVLHASNESGPEVTSRTSD
ncbi:hypothetical protein NDU88_009655 [Pleurodeles waltl]|uniref:Uncharacterized protein n=1 Tax=Pleurodeles waltl TaxID=8319 RepID=A0AAV7RX73_PLEWA|nr:hypothetical protein NDU88_009655 [Pleurodeles waltl]